MSSCSKQYSVNYLDSARRVWLFHKWWYCWKHNGQGKEITSRKVISLCANHCTLYDRSTAENHLKNSLYTFFPPISLRNENGKQDMACEVSPTPDFFSLCFLRTSLEWGSNKVIIQIWSVLSFHEDSSKSLAWILFFCFS